MAKDDSRSCARTARRDRLECARRGGLDPAGFDPAGLDPAGRALAREALAEERDLLLLSRLSRAADPEIRGLALLRLSALEPRRVERHLAVARHWAEIGDLPGALRALDVAEAVAPLDRRPLWLRLELCADLPPDAILALVASHGARFPGDPIASMVEQRCRRLLRAEGDELDAGSEGDSERRGERSVVLDAVAPVARGEGARDPRPRTREGTLKGTQKGARDDTVPAR
jgi:hypothetical protein